MRERNQQPIIICPSEVRILVKSATVNQMPGLVVLSYDELMACGNSVALEVLGEISY